MKNAKLLGRLVVASSLFIVGQAVAQELPNITYTADANLRGTTTAIAESVIINYCGDIDGCTMRIAMVGFDNSAQIASREFTFYYQSYPSKGWRTSADSSGYNQGGVTEHVFHAWACYFTDGTYSNWADLGDNNSNFGLLSWNEYYAGCRLTIID